MNLYFNGSIIDKLDAKRKRLIKFIWIQKICYNEKNYKICIFKFDLKAKSPKIKYLKLNCCEFLIKCKINLKNLKLNYKIS